MFLVSLPAGPRLSRPVTTPLVSRVTAKNLSARETSAGERTIDMRPRAATIRNVSSTGGSLVMLDDGWPTGSADLRIERIETVPLRVPLPRVYAGSHYRMTHRSTIVTRVHTACGVVGEAYAGDEDAGLIEIDGIIHKEIAPAVQGQDAMATERIWQLSRPSTWDILRDRRLALVASACVDTAVWDAVGKSLRLPLHRLWGGYRTSLPVLSIGGYYGDERPLSTEINDLISSGYSGMKLKVGGLSPDEDAQRVREARRAAGPEFKIAVD